MTLWVAGHQGNYHPAKYGDNRHYCSGDIMYEICHVISEDHVINGSCDFLWWESFIERHHPTKFGGHRHCGSGDINILSKVRLFYRKLLS